jgi:hypothetical protein
VTDPVNVSWSWFPARARLVTDPATVAQEIEAESQLQLRSVPFETWVRYSLGYAAPEVDWFLLQHTVFYIVLFNYLQTYPQEIPKYQQVGKVCYVFVKVLFLYGYHQLMSTKSPFSHRAIVECLSQFQPNSVGEASLTYAPGFEFIAGPIQALFKASRQGLYNTVKLLSVVSIRFQQTYIHVPYMDWHKKLDTQVPLLNSLLVSDSATDFARSLTRSDESKLSQLSREKLMDDKNPMVMALHERWSTLSTNVYECCTALPEIVSYIQQSAEVFLLFFFIFKVLAHSEQSEFLRQTVARCKGKLSTRLTPKITDTAFLTQLLLCCCTDLRPAARGHVLLVDQSDYRWRRIHLDGLADARQPIVPIRRLQQSRGISTSDENQPGHSIFAPAY